MRLKLLALNLTLSLPVAATATPPLVTQAPAEIAARMPELMHQTRVPGVALAKIERGRVAWTATFGTRAPDEPMTQDTVFNVASLTKPVFALMTLHLIADGELTLDSRLAEYWVDPDIAGDPRRFELTPRIALSHQTGFRNWRGNSALSFDFAPGARHEYSGEGFEYLRLAIEHKSGLPMRKQMQETVLKPSGMTATAFGWEASLAGRIATGHRANGQPYPTQSLQNRGPNAAANMLTTIGDYARFTAWVARGADLPASLFTQMQQAQALHPQPAEHFGLGWRLTRVSGNTVLSHDGREAGVRTQVFVVPATGEGLVILTSSDNGELLTRPLVEIVLADGRALMAAVDRQVWTFLQRMPVEQVSNVAQTLSSTPAFMSRLLYAANAALVQTAESTPEDRRAAEAAIDTLVSAMLEGRLSQEQPRDLVALLLAESAKGTVWRSSFTPVQRQAWIAALVERKEGRATRAAVEVPEAHLLRYAGDYRMPSSQLLISVRKVDTGLQATAEGMPVIALHAQSQTTFFMREDDTLFEFVSGNDEVTGLRVIWSGGRSEVAPRVE